METAMLVLAVVELLVVIALFYVGAKASKIDTLENSVAAKAEEVVRAEFQLNAARFEGVIAQVRTVMEGIEQRLTRGDSAFDSQDENQRRLELQAVERESHLRQWILITFGTKAEMAAISESLHQAQLKLTAFEGDLKRHQSGGRHGTH